MPLLDIVGFTATNKTFFTGFGFICDETTARYTFILKGFEEVMAKMHLAHPRVILTDKEQALMNAIEDVFNWSDNILCLWHIEKNIQAKCTPILQKEVI